MSNLLIPHEKLNVQGNDKKRKVFTLPYLIVERRWNYTGKVEVFPPIFKIVERSKQYDITELRKFSLKLGGGLNNLIGGGD